MNKVMRWWVIDTRGKDMENKPLKAFYQKNDLMQSFLLWLDQMQLVKEENSSSFTLLQLLTRVFSWGTVITCSKYQHVRRANTVQKLVSNTPRQVVVQHVINPRSYFSESYESTTVVHHIPLCTLLCAVFSIAYVRSRRVKKAAGYNLYDEGIHR